MGVKICGLTRYIDAHAAWEAGADALGFIFVRSSPRLLTQHSPDWREWMASLSGARRVAVVATPDEFPDAPQLFHALQWAAPMNLTPSAAAIGWTRELPLWVALRFPPEVAADDALRLMDAWSPYAERFVLDSYHPQQLGGTGAVGDWRRAASICARAPKPTMLAGGLTPANVADAIRAVRPAGVDVSSGVEASVGVKDHAQVQAFIQRARAALEVALG
ncbi:MAG: phosphoribosylanthranilate isomerase [Fimbriimonadales bacterium]